MISRMWSRILLGNMLRHPSPIAYKIFPSIHAAHVLPRNSSQVHTSATSLITTSSPLQFSFSGEEPIFPDLFIPDQQTTVIGIDPDVNGAIATLRWTNSLTDASPEDLAAAAHIDIFDMPTEIWQMKKREKKQPSPAAFLEILQRLQREHPEASLRAVLEFTTPGPLSGKYAWYGSGFATGLITGLFVAQDIPFERISAASWKRSLGLTKMGKDGSLALARQLFPHAAETYLK